MTASALEEITTSKNGFGFLKILNGGRQKIV